MLATYADECLSESFDQSGLVLQDILNQIGKRLSFDVIDGMYQGKKGSIGFDGIWRSSSGDDIVVEVKTTDAYSISLDQIAAYRTNLIKDGKISDRQSSLLLVVGRRDTGGLEAQIRGSRYAWDMRLISIDSLLRLMKLKETIDDLNIVNKITRILVPQEFTRVDGIIDLVFSTAEDVNATTGAITVDHEEKADTNDTLISDKLDTVEFRDRCISRIAQALKVSLTKQSRTTYNSPDNSIVISCAISKLYPKPDRYWFAFHPAQKQRLEEGTKGFAAFVCGSEQNVFLLPYEALVHWLPGLNQSTNKGRNYWHIHIMPSNDHWLLSRKKGYDHIDITKYLIA